MEYEKFYWLNEESLEFLSRGYLEKDQSAIERITQISSRAEEILGIKGYAEKFRDYMSRGWISLSSPVWSNFGNTKGLPCSCNGQYIDDTMDSILDNASEMAIMSKVGSGTSAYFGDLRHRGSSISAGGESSGPVHFMEIYNSVSEVVSQGNVRRGSFAAYLPVEHLDIEEFLMIRDEGHAIQNMSIGVTITDEWMNSMLNGDSEKRKIWAKIIKKRFETGYPYIIFIDRLNENKHQVYKDKNIKIYASNLCSEIALPASNDFSFVCTLSSLNLLHYDEWKNTDLVETLTYFLDAVNTEYAEKSKKYKHLQKASNFAENHRAIGIGVLGWHSFLQSKMIPFESMQAKFLNSEIFQLINKKSLQASKELAILFGEPEILKGYGERMTARIAIAPTTSSSFILGQVSPSIEPLNSNYFVKKLAKGNYAYRNPFLKKVLEKYNQNTEEIWLSILKKGGSVQHLSFLSEEEKSVFKTFGEISQKEIIIQASIRQKFIDQIQSLNLMVPPSIKAKEVSDLLIEGWKLGVASFYYQRSANPSQELARSLNECVSCES